MAKKNVSGSTTKEKGKAKRTAKRPDKRSDSRCTPLKFLRRKHSLMRWDWETSKFLGSMDRAMDWRDDEIEDQG
ncbi:hypothetical protein PIB30_082211 [Stylosanthes scabra]|uniref:Uncharacterized protein n=1 Tax=Stylosanthes scabra TaxID=79078 RepID=A0ABU6WRQ5_9FABA|nr:hypothetical protein [Stylosanthes scabra]